MNINPLTPLPIKLVRRETSVRRGMLLVEATVTLSIITVIGLLLLKLSMNIIQPRQQVLLQTLADAYMTYERAAAEQISFAELKTWSEWPKFPDTSATQRVTLGRIQGGTPVYGLVVRTCFPDENNYPENGGVGTLETNPSALEVWRLQSVLTFEVGGRTYAKSRTVIRSQ